MAGGTPSSLDGFADHGKSEHQLDENWGCPHFRIAPYLLVGGFNHLEKYESQFGLLFSIYVKKIKHVTNHQPDYIISVFWWDFTYFFYF